MRLLRNKQTNKQTNKNNNHNHHNNILNKSTFLCLLYLKYFECISKVVAQLLSETVLRHVSSFFQSRTKNFTTYFMCNTVEEKNESKTLKQTHNPKLRVADIFYLELSVWV